MKAFFVLAALLLGLPLGAHAQSKPNKANVSRSLRISGTVPYRIDRVIQMNEEGVQLKPENEPSLKVYVLPLAQHSGPTRGPASVTKLERRILSSELVSDSSRLIVEAP
jgi:hypothetical protein